MSLGKAPVCRQDTNQEAGLLISIIVAVYNGAGTLQRCIDSVAQQSYPNKEMIIIDGGSKDATVDVLKANQEKIAYWISEPDRGIYNAWNKGLAQAQGEWICFLGADDWLCDSETLGDVAESLKQVSPCFEIVYGQVKMVNAVGSDAGQLGAPWETVKQAFTNGTYCLPTPGIFHRRSVFTKYGNFDETYAIAGDYELLLRVLRSSAPIFLEGITVSNMQQGGISSRPASALISLREMVKARRKNKMSNCSFGLFVAFFRVYLRSILWSLLGERWTRSVLDMGRKIIGKAPYWTKV